MLIKTPSKIKFKRGASNSRMTSYSNVGGISNGDGNNHIGKRTHLDKHEYDHNFLRKSPSTIKSPHAISQTLGISNDDHSDIKQRRPNTKAPVVTRIEPFQFQEEILDKHDGELVLVSEVSKDPLMIGPPLDLGSMKYKDIVSFNTNS